MKSVILFANMLLCCWLPTVQAQQKLEWVKTMGSTSDDVGRAIALDKAGNVYTTGYFKGTVNFNPGGTSPVNLTAENNDIFVTRHDMNGNLLWAVKMGGSGDDQSYGIAVDSIGNVYTTGYFYGTADFDPGSNIEPLSANGSSMAIFISKLDSNGNYVWAKSVGNTSLAYGYDIAVDKSGNVYTTGYFSNTVDFNPDPVASASLISEGSSDVFILKLNTNGEYVWAIRMGGNSSDQGRAITLDDAGNIYTTGHFMANGDFGIGGGGVNQLYANGGYDVFISKLNPDGHYIWARNLGGDLGGNSSISTDYGEGIAVDKAGNVYTTGFFQGEADFDPGHLIYKLSATGIRDAFVSKLNADGNFVWAKRFGGTSYTTGNALLVDDDNIYITGFYESIVDFDPGPDTAHLTSVGNESIFVCNLDTAGNYKWVAGMGSTGSSNYDDAGTSIAIDQSGSIYTTGYFSNNLDFDPGTNTVTRYSAGFKDIFILKLGHCLNSTSSITGEVCHSYTLNGEVYTTSGTYTQTFKNSCGSDSIITVIVTIHPTPDMTITQNGTALVAPEAATYQWLDCNQGKAPIDGAVNREYTPELDGSYAVIITTANGCTDTSTCHEIRVGIGGSDEEAAWEVHPNPFTGNVHITSGRPLNNAAIRVINMTGQVVLKGQGISGPGHTIDMTGYPAGFYFMEITEGNKAGRVKLVKE